MCEQHKTLNGMCELGDVLRKEAGKCQSSQQPLLCGATHSKTASMESKRNSSCVKWRGEGVHVLYPLVCGV